MKKTLQWMILTALAGLGSQAQAAGEGGACYVKVIKQNSTTTTCHQTTLVDCNKIVSQVRDAVRESWEIGAKCNPARETRTKK